METTQLQKAIVIAKKDGALIKYPNLAFINTNDKDSVLPSNIHELYQRYTTDLNYLMPIAVKVRDEIAEKPQGYGVYSRLYDAYCDLKLDSNNQYTELFEALFNAIKILENERA